MWDASHRRPRGDRHLGPLLVEVGDFDLLRFEDDPPWLVAKYESSVAQAIEQILRSSGVVVRIEGADAVSHNADRSARNAFRFSLY